MPILLFEENVQRISIHVSASFRK